MLRSWTLSKAHRIACLRIIGAVAAAMALCIPATAGATLYATSLRSDIGGGSLIAGNLYAIDPANAAATLVGAIRIGETPVGIAAIAAHPRTGVVYGITAGLASGIPRSLVSIDLDKAVATIIAQLSVRGSDVGFDSDGTLFMWAPELHQVVKLDLETGAATPVGHAEITGAAEGAIAIDVTHGKALVAVSGAHGTLDSVDLATGEVTRGPKLSGAPHDASIDNLTFSPSGVLYAVNSDGGAPSHAALVIIDPVTGAIINVGRLPHDVRGLIFASERREAISPDRLRLWALGALAAAALGLILYAAARR